LILLKSDKLVWEIGKLSPGATVVLEYRILGGQGIAPGQVELGLR